MLGSVVYGPAGAFPPPVPVGPLHQSRAGVLLGSGPLGLSRAKTSPISPYLSRPALIFAKRETAEATIPIPPIKTGIKAHTICEYIPHLR